MSKQTDQLNPIIEMLETLKETPERDPARAAAGREQFLTQAKQVSGQTVSVSWLSRLKDVFGPARPALQLSTLTIALVIGMLLLGFSSSVVAAQQAQPDQLLYPYRLWLEDQRLALTSNPESRLKLHLQYAEDRLEELQLASFSPGDPEYDRTTANFTRQISAANALLLQSQLNGSIREKLEYLDREYRDLYDDDPEELDDDHGTLNDAEDMDDDRDENGIESDQVENPESSEKYEKESEDSDTKDDDNGDEADGSDDQEDGERSDDSGDSDNSDNGSSDETDKPDDDDGSSGSNDDEDDASETPTTDD